MALWAERPLAEQAALHVQAELHTLGRGDGARLAQREAEHIQIAAEAGPVPGLQPRAGCDRLAHQRQIFRRASSHALHRRQRVRLRRQHALHAGEAADERVGRGVHILAGNGVIEQKFNDLVGLEALEALAEHPLSQPVPVTAVRVVAAIHGFSR